MKTPDLTIFNTQEGRLRLLSGIMLGPVVLAVVYLGAASYAGLMILITTTALFEWLRLVDPDAPKDDCYAMYAAHILAVILAAMGMPSMGLIVVAFAAVVFYSYRGNADPQRGMLFAFGLPYMAISGIALIYLRSLPAIGLSITIYLLAIVWGMDIGAYVAGRLIGGPKLAPVISPNKTWAGLIGGMVLAVCLSSVVLVSTGAHSIFFGVLIAMLLSVVAQMGDLFKSHFKRKAGVKDCGNIIPGHGGVLDRIDGLVFAGLVLAFLQAVFGSHLIW